jgi:hypothetical protein
MKRAGVCLIVLLLIFSSITLTLAQNTTDTTNTTDTSDTTHTTTSTTVTTTSTTETLGNLSYAFDCLEEKAGDDCKNTNTIAELAFTILATPDNIMKGCIEKLKTKEKDNNFGTIKDTSLALLALNHAGEDTERIESWLISKKQNSKDLIWFLQEDSDGEVDCTIDDETLKYDIKIDENKKINMNAGECLKLAQSNFWYKVEPSCFDKLFQISCNQDFITNLLYKNQKSSTIYVLEDTQQSPAFGKTEHRIESKCLGIGANCDYEGTAWGAIALQETENNIEDLIPYLIATSDLKRSYLPNAFIFILTRYENYGTKLILEQKFGAYWEAESSMYNKYYDTALALLGLGTGQAQTLKAKNWLLFEQGNNGCWANSVRETAFILWVLTNRQYETGSTTVFCESSGFHCTAKTACPSVSDLGESYYCFGLSNTCCEENILSSCYDMNGETCSNEKVCKGLVSEASDTTSCCLAGCEEPEEQESECEENGFNCFSTCNEELQDPEPLYTCSENLVCCKTKTTEPSKGIPWWIWLLLLLIIIVLAAIIYLYKDKIFKKKKDEEDEEGRRGMPPRRPGMPAARPGMPPRRPGMPPRRPGMPPRRPGMRPRRPRPGMPRGGRPPVKRPGAP